MTPLISSELFSRSISPSRLSIRGRGWHQSWSWAGRYVNSNKFTLCLLSACWTMTSAFHEALVQRCFVIVFFPRSRVDEKGQRESKTGSDPPGLEVWSCWRLRCRHSVKNHLDPWVMALGMKYPPNIFRNISYWFGTVLLGVTACHGLPHTPERQCVCWHTGLLICALGPVFTITDRLYLEAKEGKKISLKSLKQHSFGGKWKLVILGNETSCARWVNKDRVPISNLCSVLKLLQDKACNSSLYLLGSGSGFPRGLRIVFFWLLYFKTSIKPTHNIKLM